jgi:hypothetical protein
LIESPRSVNANKTPNALLPLCIGCLFLRSITDEGNQVVAINLLLQPGIGHLGAGDVLLGV